MWACAVGIILCLLSCGGSKRSVKELHYYDSIGRVDSMAVIGIQQAADAVEDSLRAIEKAAATQQN
jgi:hypothetical protein